MIDIESRVAETLRARADEHVDVEQLRAGTLARAGAIRRRRTWAASAAAGLVTVAVAAITATVVAAPGPEPAGGTGDPASLATGVAGEPGADGGPTTLPGLTGVPSAAAQPGVVGTDPAVLHLDVDLAAVNATASDWRSGPGYEGVTLQSPGGLVDIYIGPDSAALEAGRPAPGPVMHLDDGTTEPLYQETEPEPTTVDGTPGTLQLATFDVDELDLDAPPGASIDHYSTELGEHTRVLRWQPVAGLHAIVQVRGGGEADAFAAASALRLDRVQRCLAPFQVTQAPAGTDWTECRISVAHHAGGDWDWTLGSVSFVGAGGDEVMVHVEDAAQVAHPGDLERIVPNRTVAGEPAWWSEESPAGLYLPKLGPVSVFVSGLDEPAAAQLVEGLTVAGDLDRPESWPA